jgi:DNA repair protein RadC
MISMNIDSGGHADTDTGGHRRRLREKFLRSGLAGLHDYEIIELLLSLGTPRKDCKHAAREALKRFKDLRGVLDASPEELTEIDGIGKHSAFGIKLIREASREYLRTKIIDMPFVSSSQEVFDYLYHAMRGLKHEVFKVIYLTSQNRVIDTVDLPAGTVNSSTVSVRSVIEGAIRSGAAGMVLVHNHPSGNPEPSKSDRELTRRMVHAARLLQISLPDHIIIGDNRYFSFAAAGSIQQYETELLRLTVD